MENKAKVMDNYLCNLKLTVSKTRLKMLCHVALICTIYCITNMIYTVACKEIKVVRFRGSLHFCLLLSYVNQTTKNNLAKNCISFGGGISKKRQNLYHHSNYLRTWSFWCQVVAKDQTYLNKPNLSRFDLFLRPVVRV